MPELQAVQIDNAELLHALEHNAEFFLHFCLGEELTYPVPQFHKDIFRQMTQTTSQLYCCAVPRDHAKTTLAKLSAVWYFLFSDYRFILYISNTSNIAVEACRDIISTIECDNMIATFGVPRFYTRQEGLGLYRWELGKKMCILRALGAGQQVRGLNIDQQRPQVIIIDDLESVENIATEDQYNKLKRWTYGTLFKAADKFSHKIIQIGNMISSKCLIAEHCADPDWESVHYGAILADGTPLWPEAWPVEKLMADYNRYKRAGMVDTWLQEMQNLPVAGSGGLIHAEEIKYTPRMVPGDCQYGFITIDLAISSQTWAHKTAVCVHGWNGECWTLCEVLAERGWEPVELFNTVIYLTRKWHVFVIAMEAVAFQAALKPVFEYLSRSMGIYNLTFVPLLGTTQKTQRILSWCFLLKSGDYKLPEDDVAITHELLSYNPRRNNNSDDSIDAAAYSVQVLERYLPMVMEERGLIGTGKVVNSYEIARV